MKENIPSGLKEEQKFIPILNKLKDFANNNHGNFSVKYLASVFNCAYTSLYIPIRQLQRDGVIKFFTGQSYIEIPNPNQPPSSTSVQVEGKTGVELIAEERKRQREEEGWTPEHDAAHKTFELSGAAACYIAKNISKKLEDINHTNQSPLAEFKIYDFGESDFMVNNGDRGDRRLRKAGWKNGWPWDQKWWKPSDDPIRNLVKAGALIAAEIDRLQNLEK